MKGFSPVLCSAQALPEGDAPDWLHLLPAGTVTTVDGRGPYQLTDTAAVIAASLEAAGGKLPIDECHAIDRAAPLGLPAPARGWIVELQGRDDGLWGRVEWTEQGRQIMADRQYRGLSPAIVHDKLKNITAVLRASLINTPNLVGLTALHSEGNQMDLLARLIEALGLDAGADGDAVIAAIKKLKDMPAPALQSALAPIGAALGLAAGADATAVLAGVQQLTAAKGDSAAIVALQGELATTAQTLADLLDSNKRRDATTFVDGAIAEGRVGVKPMRERYIALHMADPVATAAQVAALPAIKPGATFTGTDPGRAADGLSAEDERTIALMGIDRAAFLETRKLEVL
ncbi:phage protease [Sphingomonas sp.]|uniref:phage protease n=1 Tax=Sphingomonas sp. TaxID=28214 RepID=UPI003CC68AE8